MLFLHVIVNKRVTDTRRTINIWILNSGITGADEDWGEFWVLGRGVPIGLGVDVLVVEELGVDEGLYIAERLEVSTGD